MIRRTLLAAGFLVPPFLFLGWMLWSPDTLGNDYPHQIPPPMFLRFMTGEGLEPMWCPHQTGGVPIGGVFFAQYFHLPAWITSKLPGFWSGEVLRLTSLRHLLLLALAHALFYAGFRRGVGLATGRSYLLAFACVYHLRNLDALRYEAGIEGTLYAQAVVLLTLLHVLAPSRILLLLVAIVSQLLLTCGYPVAIPFAALAAALGAPVLVQVVGVGRLVGRGLQALGAALIGFLLAAPNWMALSEWLSVNELRVTRPTIDWAAAWSMQAPGLLDNVIRPWRAEVHSAFGGATLLTLVLVSVTIALLRRWRGSWAVLVLLVFPLLYALGRATPLFPFFFAYVPGFASLRVPGRALVMLPLGLVFAVLWLKRAARPPQPHPGDVGLPELRAACVLTSFAGLAALAWLAASPVSTELPAFSAATLSEYWTPPHQAWWLVAGLLAALAAVRARTSRLAVAVLVVASGIQTGMLLRHGTWTDRRPSSPSREAFRRADHLPLYARAPLFGSNDLNEHSDGTATRSYSAFIRAAGPKADCFLPVQHVPRFKGILLPFYLTNQVACATDRRGALLRLGEGCRPQLPAGSVVLEAPCPERPTPAAEPAAEALCQLNEHNGLLALTTNRVTLEVEAPSEAILVTPFPDATRNWSGSLDGRPAPLLRIDGALLGVRVPEGRHTVGVAYFSRRLVLGYRIAFTTALALAAAALFLLAWRITRRTALRLVLLASLLAALAAAAVPAYGRWERRFEAAARSQAKLNNSYPELLARQLARWQRAAAAPLEARAPQAPGP